MTKSSVLTGLFLLAYASVSISQPRFYPPVNLGYPINTASHEWDPFLTVDGKKLFFVRDFDIWYAEWNGTDWVNPVKLGPQINTGPDGETSPSVTPDGQKLFFVAGSRQGFYYDIWVSTWDSSLSDWGTPVNVGPSVNTLGAEFSTHLAPDGQHLYFTSDGAGRCGIYMSEWNGSSWSDPQLQWGSCTPEYPSVTADGRWLYFDNWVSDGKSIFVAAWDDSIWVLPSYNLQSQIGDSSWTPFIVSSGDSLFFNSNRAVGGRGGSDIWMAKQVLLGDLNLDGQQTAADVVLQLNKVFLAQPYPAQEARGDMNCDGIFSPTDVVILLRLVFLDMLPDC